MKIIEDEIAAFFPSMSEERRRALACDDATCQAVLPLHNQQFTGLDQCCVAIATAVGTIVGAYMAIYGEEIAAGL